jgi:hypothetical protein
VVRVQDVRRVGHDDGSVRTAAEYRVRWSSEQQFTHSLQCCHTDCPSDRARQYDGSAGHRRRKGSTRAAPRRERDERRFRLIAYSNSRAPFCCHGCEYDDVIATHPIHRTQSVVGRRHRDGHDHASSSVCECSATGAGVARLPCEKSRHIATMPAAKKYAYDLGDLKLEYALGRGNFGVVWKGVYKVYDAATTSSSLSSSSLSSSLSI